jgi:dTDP-4-dehydrorhamnose reductase
MLRLGKEREVLNVVYDQVGSPTYAGDLAGAILKIAEQFNQNRESIQPGVYHYSNEGAISWYDFAKAIFEMSGISCKVQPILSREFKMEAPRPHYSVFDKSKIKNNFQLEIPYWKESLEKCIKKLMFNKE